MESIFFFFLSAEHKSFEKLSNNIVKICCHVFYLIYRSVNYGIRLNLIYEFQGTLEKYFRFIILIIILLTLLQATSGGVFKIDRGLKYTNM